MQHKNRFPQDFSYNWNKGIENSFQKKPKFPISDLPAIFWHLCKSLALSAVNFLVQSEILIRPSLVEQVATHQKQNLTGYTNSCSSYSATTTDKWKRSFS